MTKQDFINQLGPIVVKVARERNLGNAQIWTCIAQACCESAFGTSKLMSNANAYFGIKATNSWIKNKKYGGLVYDANTKECYDGQTYTNIRACFRAYNSMEDSVRDYFDLLSLSRYRASLSKQTVLDCITDIKNGGYATAPNYISTIVNIYEQYKADIEKYNVESTTSVRTIKDILIDMRALIDELIDRY